MSAVPQLFVMTRDDVTEQRDKRGRQASPVLQSIRDKWPLGCGHQRGTRRRSQVLDTHFDFVEYAGSRSEPLDIPLFR